MRNLISITAAFMCLSVEISKPVLSQNIVKGSPPVDTANGLEFGGEWYYRYLPIQLCQAPDREFFNAFSKGGFYRKASSLPGCYVAILSTPGDKNTDYARAYKSAIRAVIIYEDWNTAIINFKKILYMGMNLDYSRGLAGAEAAKDCKLNPQKYNGLTPYEVWIAYTGVADDESVCKICRFYR